MGCEVTKDYAQRLVGTKKVSYPGPWVMDRQHRTDPKSITWVDLELHHAGVNPLLIGMEDCDYDDTPLSQLATGMKDIIVETKTAEADTSDKDVISDSNHFWMIPR